MAEHTGAASLTGWQLAVQVRNRDVPADAPVALRQSVALGQLEMVRTSYVARLLRRTGSRSNSNRHEGDAILAAYQVLHERGELLGEELRP